MPALALVGLILTIVKVALDLATFLKDHPDVPYALQQALQGASERLQQTHADLSTPYSRQDVQAP